MNDGGIETCDAMGGEVASAVAALTGAVDALLAVSFTAARSRSLPEVARLVEQQVRRLPVFDHALVAELDRRGVAAEVGARDTATLLRGVLRISPGEARARVRAAGDLGPRYGLTGQPLPAVFPTVAAAQTTGSISTEHARVITSTIDRLPAAVQAEHCDTVETTLTAQAGQFPPDTLRRLALHVRNHLDPDGTLTDERDHQRLRELTLALRADGSARLTGDLTPECAATWQTVLDSLSAPAPAADGTPDPRTAGQRRHDGFHDAGRRLLRVGDLPDSGGTPATVLLSMTLEQLESRTGLVTTAHGGQISVAAALRLAGEADLIPTVFDSAGGILAYGRCRRDATARQRHALAARDRGCSFPGCDVPPAWCQAHHVIAWADGGLTNLDNLTLVCGFHHRQFERLGWRCVMTDGVPHWIPPTWIDPAQKPQRNHACHLERLLRTPATTTAEPPPPSPPPDETPPTYRPPPDRAHQPTTTRLAA